ncbi:MAG: HDOD domain-containing protein [Candidatus Omnitrophota bacterium]
MDSKNIISSLQLPTLSKTLLEIIEVEKKNSITLPDDIRRILEKDPLLSAHILKVANSPLYGFHQKVRTISHALGLLGIRKIKALAFSFSIFDFLKKLDYKQMYGGVFNLILKKTLLVSSCSTILATKINYMNSEELYISGLLAEIGELLLFLYDPNKYCPIYTINDRKLIPKERELFQTDHVKLGVFFCEFFNLPGFFKTAIENHTTLQQGEEPSKIAFIANQIAELLLVEDEAEKAEIFTELENHTKKLLRLSLSDIEGTVKGLPDIMDAFTSDFPEMQKDLRKTVEAGSVLIIRLMKREMEMIVLNRELSASQKKLVNEKIFLSHMLNLSYFLSSLSAPLKVIGSLFEYFDNFINEFTIEFIYRFPDTENLVLIKNKENMAGTPFDIEKFPNLQKSRISNEAVRLEKHEMEELGKNPYYLISLVFPISYHHNFFGFLLLNVEKNKYFEFDLEMTYVQILSNIIGNSFMNYSSFEGKQIETNKKALVTHELINIDKKMSHSRETVIELQKIEIMGDLLPVIFHKLKNKLTPILGYSQILLSKSPEPGVNEKLKKIEKNANELTDQLNLLREYFKPKKIIKERDNLNQVLNHLKTYFEEIEVKHNIVISMDEDFAVPDDLINSGQIETLITNIVDNSVLALEQEKGKENRLIAIKTEAGKDSYKLTIKDNGIGMSQENIPKIWSPFYTTFPGHPGIGLAVCEKIIQNHDGICIVNSKEGEFTEFEITFKRSLLEGEKSPLLELPPTKKSALQAKILIVDDEAFLVDLMKEILLNEGDFEVITSTSGKEALALLESEFDLVISDIRMPEVNGMDLFEFMKSKHKESRMIMVTADPFSEDVAMFLNKNKVKYLKKPFELMRFKQLVLENLN